MVSELTKQLMGKVANHYNTANIFLDNYNKMNEADTEYCDKYFHGLANCEAVHKGALAGPLIFDVAKEVNDLWNKNHADKNGATYENNVMDSLKDLYVDFYGYAEGLGRFHDDCKDIMRKYRPKGLDDKY